MIKTKFIVLGVLILSFETTRSESFIANDRISGTPRLELTEETLEQIPRRTSQLQQPFLHKPKQRAVPGESAQFYVYNFQDEKYSQESATLRYTDGVINIWVSDTEWSNGHVNTQVVQQVYEGLMLQTPSSSVDSNKGIVEIIQANFGMPPDFDGDGITDFLLTDIKDGWEEGEGFIAGYFNPLDQYINGTFVGRTQISGSNERDLLYVDTYPGIYHQDNYSYNGVLSTVSHEYQHLIHYHYDINEVVFVNEGLSELSSFMCGYGLRNPAKYLVNTNISLTGWESGLPEALAHYAKSALWTYFLYEKLGPFFIKELTQSGQAGVAGIEAALRASGMEMTFNDLLQRFFITITLNTRVGNNDFAFDWVLLQGLRAAPQLTITDYPMAAGIKNPENALGVYRFENGDTLSVSLGNPPSNLQFFINRYGDEGQATYLEPLTSLSYTDVDFGRIWQADEMMVINSGTNAVWSLSASASQKSYVTGYLLTDQKSDLQIQIAQEAVANSFVVPYDSCALRSVRFYNLQASGGVRISVYNEALADGRDPDAKSMVFETVLQGEWVELDISRLNIWRDTGETFDVGIEFLNGGIMGYTASDVNAVRSFFYRPADGIFRELSNFKVEDTPLTGQWLLDISYAAPIRYKPGGNGEIPASFTIESIGPLPFPSPANSELRIQYTLNRPGNLKVEIFNIRGQKVKTLFDGFEAGLAGTLSWAGDNDAGIPIATGAYFLHIRFEDQPTTYKLLVVR